MEIRLSERDHQRLWMDYEKGLRWTREGGIMAYMICVFAFYSYLFFTGKLGTLDLTPLLLGAGILAVVCAMPYVYKLRSLKQQMQPMPLSKILKERTNSNLLSIEWQHDTMQNLHPLIQHLQSDPSITHLNLPHNQLGDARATRLAQFLQTNTSITHLNLTHNQIGNSGAQALASMLKRNNSLKTLQLDWNEMGEPGFQAFSEALKINTRLNKLFITNNILKFESSLNLLQDAVTHNDYITQIVGWPSKQNHENKALLKSIHQKLADNKNNRAAHAHFNHAAMALHGIMPLLLDNPEMKTKVLTYLYPENIDATVSKARAFDILGRPSKSKIESNSPQVDSNQSPKLKLA